MNIRDAILLAQSKNGWLMKRDRTPEWCLRVAVGSVFRNKDDSPRELDARDCRGDDWYVVDENRNELEPTSYQPVDLQFAKDLSYALWERSILRHGMFTPPQFAALCEAAIVDFLAKLKSV